MSDITNINDYKDEVEKVEEISTENTEIKTRQKENGITVKNLISGYLRLNSIKTKEEYLKLTIKTKDYIGYAVKIALADGIIKTSCLKNNRVHIDSCKRYLLYIYALIDTYTNIELSQKEWLFQYDRLDSLGLIEKIIALIPEKERVTFKTILDMKQDDLMTNKYELHSFIADQVATIYPEFTKALTPLIEKATEKLETLDESKIEKMLNRVMKLVTK